MKIEFNVDNHQPTLLRPLSEFWDQVKVFYLDKMNPRNPPKASAAEDGFYGEWCYKFDGIIFSTRGDLFYLDDLNLNLCTGRPAEPGEILNVRFKIGPEDKVTGES